MQNFQGYKNTRKNKIVWLLKSFLSVGEGQIAIVQMGTYSEKGWACFKFLNSCGAHSKMSQGIPFITFRLHAFKSWERCFSTTTRPIDLKLASLDASSIEWERSTVLENIGLFLHQESGQFSCCFLSFRGYGWVFARFETFEDLSKVSIINLIDSKSRGASFEPLLTKFGQWGLKIW